MTSRDVFIAGAAQELCGTLTAINIADKMTDEERAAVPDWWLRLVELDAADAIAVAVGQWRTALPTHLNRFLAILTSQGIDVVLARTTSDLYRGIALVYGIHIAGEQPRYIVGYPPVAKLSGPAALFPAEFQSFYSTIHDGFGYHLQQPMGLRRTVELIDWETETGQSRDDLRFLRAAPSLRPNPAALYQVYDENLRAEIFVDVDPKDAGVWSTDCAAFDDRSREFSSAWELIDDWMSVYFAPID